MKQSKKTTPQPVNQLVPKSMTPRERREADRAVFNKRFEAEKKAGKA